ncbi:MAG TPA: thymidylate synthase [Peptostreptococcaceae bacterium]|nr:thymidylate synthase [Peptostreptococcaceae bacterium]
MNKVDKLFFEACSEVMNEGQSTLEQKVRPVYSDGVPAHTKYITHVCETYDISKGEFPITTLRPVPWKNGIKEILWIYQDQTTDLSVLKEKYNIHWWDSWEYENSGSIGECYGYIVKKYDLINKLLDGLKNNPLDRGHIINLWQYMHLDNGGLRPCAFMTTWNVRGEYLDLCLHQRSSDYLVAGHINKIQYVALLMMVAKSVGLTPGKFTHFIDNLHIYDRHFEQAKEMLNRKPSEKQPRLILDTDKTDFYSFTIDDFKMEDYEPVRPQLSFDLGI